VRVYNWTSREPVFAAGKEDMLEQSLNKGLIATGLPFNGLGIEI
jgi:hypothetical protein